MEILENKINDHILTEALEPLIILGKLSRISNSVFKKLLELFSSVGNIGLVH